MLPCGGGGGSNKHCLLSLFSFVSDLVGNQKTGFLRFMFQELSLSSVVVPCVVMMMIGLIHSQTVLTHFSLKPPVRDNKR